MDVKARKRFWTKVARGAVEECWLWKAGTTGGGYGMFYRNGSENITAHRMAYLLEYGEIDAGLQVAHTCDTPRCCNPRHLFLATLGENAQDALAKGRKKKHLSPEEIELLQKRATEGISREVLALEFGVHEATVYKWTQAKAKYERLPRLPRARKSRPFAVRLPVPLAEWVERYAKENALTKTEVMEAAVRKLKLLEGRRFNGKRRALLDTIKRADDGSEHSIA